MLTVNLTRAGDDEGEWSRGSGCGHGVPHRGRSAGAIDDEPPSLPGPLGVIRKIDSGLGVSVAHSSHTPSSLPPPRSR